MSTHHPTWICGSGAFDENTPAIFRDADFADPKNAWMITKMEESMTILNRCPMFMVKRDGSKFVFSSHGEIDQAAADWALAAAKKATIVAEEKDKGIIKITCWNCDRCFCAKISVCGRCSKARYCSDVCQRRHWPQHAVKCPVWKKRQRQRKKKK